MKRAGKQSQATPGIGPDFQFETFLHRLSLEEHAWVGEAYRRLEKKGVATFLLGESFYDRERNIPAANPSAWLVQHAALGAHRHRYYAVVAKLLSDEGSEAKAATTFWSEVAFYHFVQTSVGSGPRVAKPAHCFRENVSKFQRVLADTTPSRIVVLGKSLWRFLCQNNIVQETDSLAGIIESRGRRIRAIATHHPTAFAKISVWQKHIQENSPK